jgi:hypothetical protein
MYAMTENGLPAASFFDQWLLSALLRTPDDGFLSSGKYRILRGIRQLRLILSDPIVVFPLGQCRLCLPLSHELPFYKKMFPEYGLNLGKVSFHVRQKETAALPADERVYKYEKTELSTSTNGKLLVANSLSYRSLGAD